MRLHHAYFVIFGDETCIPISFVFVLPICGTSGVSVRVIDLYKLASTRYVSVEINRIEDFSLYMFLLPPQGLRSDLGVTFISSRNI